MSEEKKEETLKNSDEEIKEELDTKEENNSNEETSKSDSHEASKEDENNNEEKNIISDLEKKIEELEKEVADNKDKFIRAHAEMENIRKRSEKDKIDIIKRANKNLLLSLLGFLDNFERAIKEGSKNTDIQGSEYFKGIELIHKQFIDFIADQGITEIEALDCEFDPQVHEALTMIEVPDLDMEKVVEVYAKGYKLNDELLRTAKVVVGKPANK